MVKSLCSIALVAFLTGIPQAAQYRPPPVVSETPVKSTYKAPPIYEDVVIWSCTGGKCTATTTYREVGATQAPALMQQQGEAKPRLLNFGLLRSRPILRR